jgi:hypothetical protein
MHRPFSCWCAAAFVLVALAALGCAPRDDGRTRVERLHSDDWWEDEEIQRMPSDPPQKHSSEPPEHSHEDPTGAVADSLGGLSGDESSDGR